MKQDCEMIKNFQGSDSEIADSIKSNIYYYYYYFQFVKQNFLFFISFKRTNRSLHNTYNDSIMYHDCVCYFAFVCFN